MRGMNTASVDLIYADPPFNSNANYAAPIGSAAAGAAFKDTWGLSDINLAWYGLIKADYPGLYDLLGAVRTLNGDSMMSYLIYMAVRTIEMHRILKPTGSLYLHCDPTASHYLKLMLDSIYGYSQSRNELVWCYSGGGVPRRDFPRKHDVILRYAKGDEWTFHVERKPYKANTQAVGKHSTYSGGADIDLERGTPVTDWWTDIKTVTGWNVERIGYPTQKPLALVERIIKASSNPDDMVLDPFCGCATACIAAERQGRQWVGIDISEKAAELVEQRMADELGLFYRGTHRHRPPFRTDIGNIPRYNCLDNKRWLYGEQGGLCNACATLFELRHLEVDHIIAVSRGGTDHLSNLQLLCGNCNRMKGDRPQEELIAKLTDKGWIKRQAA